MANIKVNTKSVNPDIYSQDIMNFPVVDTIGQVFTADWKQRLLKAGKLWSVTVGTLATGADISGVLGGGGGICVDSDQPEIIIGVDAGYYLIPVEVDVVTQPDMDTDLDEGRIFVFADRTTAVAAGATATTETPANLLDGAGSFPGRAYSAVTADIVDTTMDELLAAKIRKMQGTVAESQEFSLHYEPSVPSVLAGPCSLVVCWGGTAQLYGIARVVVGCVPVSWFPTS